LYVAFVGARTSGITVFVRDPHSGALTRASGEAGCVSDGLPTCARARQFNRVTDVAVAPDGKTVYVSSALDAIEEERERGGIAVFARDRHDGSLRQLPGRSGCVNSTRARGCLHDTALEPPLRHGREP
jgi:6-phosphogluconolactonase (cycloisomerase 2 family)